MRTGNAYFLRVGAVEHDAVVKLSQESGLPQTAIANLAVRHFVKNAPEWFRQLEATLPRHDA